MLHVENISKVYHTGKVLHPALDHVSLSFRDNEFVAILGPSGSGKTTLLNVIGGLDHYDSGDLIINGVSTKKYTDRDWDSYRNHTIGFVFQSYNLIPHQSILSNVELALTISGIGKTKRRQMAKKALEEVGLGDQIGKKPSQLSGGQMQRVAIARALVNDPDILLADEPTGALDSETSVQVMELLQKVAKDRLVVMVTHNPELANVYATRIIELKDGKICSDTDPAATDVSLPEKALHKNMGKSSMSFLTALSLSFHNLQTKKARTLLISFAGSIGIIGIALILAASAGVNAYIASEEEAMLNEYPLEILSTTVDLNTLLGVDERADQKNDQKIGVVSTLTKLFSTVGSNDLKSLKTYLDSGETDIDKYTAAIEYSYNVTPHIYRLDGENYRQINPDSSMDAVSTGILSADASPISALFNTDVFFQLPESEKLYKNQYEIKSGRWPESRDECVVVLTSDGGISDVMLYALGLRDAAELEEMLEQFVGGKNVEVPEDMGTYSPEDIMDVTFRLVNSADYYQYDDEYQTWIDKTDDAAYIQNLAENGETLKIVGIVQPTEDTTGGILSAGIYYPASLTRHIVDQAKKSEIVKEQLADAGTDVFTGKPFGEEQSGESFDLDSLFDLDDGALSDAFRFDSSELEQYFKDSMDLSAYLQQGDVSEGLLNGQSFDEDFLDLSGLLDAGQVKLSVPDTAQIDMEEMLENLSVNISAEDAKTIVSHMFEGYQSYAKEHPEADYSGLADSFLEYLKTDAAKAVLSENIRDIIQANGDIMISSDAVNELLYSVLEDYQRYVTENGYTETDNLAEHFREYMQTQEAQAVVSAWSEKYLVLDPDIEISGAQMEKMVSELAAGYMEYVPSAGLPDPGKMGDYFVEYLNSETARDILLGDLEQIIDADSLEEQIADSMERYMNQMIQSNETQISQILESQISSVMAQLMDQIAGQISAGMTQALGEMSGQMGESIADAIDMDPESLLEAFGMDMDSAELLELLTSLTASYSSTYEGNLEKLGYADFADPHSISIYPYDFEGKEQVLGILDDYNSKMKEAGKEAQIISYSDTSGTLMSSMTEIIDIISYVMIGVVAISLVVSSIMIGVITYISVLERKKEIGILRALGASKGNISQVFNAETVIVGLCAGLLGIGIAYILLVPANLALHSLLELDTIRLFLPIRYAALLVAISVALTLISGLFPAMRAARNDPVEALRTE